MAGGCFSNQGPVQKLVFKATPLPGANSNQIDLEQVKTIINGRLRSARLKNSAKVEIVGSNKLAVIVRGADQETLDKINNYVTDWGLLEFAEVAHPDHNAELIKLAQDAEHQVLVDGEVQAEWLPVRRDAAGKPHEHLANEADVVTRERDDNGKQVKEWLVVYEPGFRITGNQLESATENLDPTGGPSIAFSLNDEGAGNMKALTTQLKPRGAVKRKLAIILNGQIYSAPNVQSPIDGHGEITGRFTKEEVQRTVNVLRSGSLPCRLTFEELIDESTKKK
jgi:SecD/SecF fusion protein